MDSLQELLSRLGVEKPVAEMRDLGDILESVFWHLVSNNMADDANVFAEHAARLPFSHYDACYTPIRTRVNPSTVANRFVTWFDLARMVARHDPTTVCFNVFNLLRLPAERRPTPCRGFELLMRLYVDQPQALDYLTYIMTRSANPELAVPFLEMCGPVLCPPFRVLQHAGLCDPPITCAACTASPGVCRLYGLKDRLTREELFDVCSLHGLTSLALGCISTGSPVESLFRNALRASYRCGADVGLVIRRGLDGLQQRHCPIDEVEMARWAYQSETIRHTDAQTLVAFVREMSRRPSWNTTRFTSETIRALRGSRPSSKKGRFITNHLLPFLTALAPLLAGPTDGKLLPTLHRVDADHTLVRILQHAGPISGPALNSLFSTLDRIVTTMY